MTNRSSRTLRDRIVAAAAVQAERDGWATVTISGLARHVGVSRQTVHTEVGTRRDLAEAVVARELGAFLGDVDAAFDRHADVVAGTRAAVTAVLQRAQHNRLLRSVIAPHATGPDDLLPLITTDSRAVLDAARHVVAIRLRADGRIDDERLEDLVDTVVRAVMSNVVQPDRAPADVADAMAWLVALATGR